MPVDDAEEFLNSRRSSDGEAYRDVYVDITFRLEKPRHNQLYGRIVRATFYADVERKTVLHKVGGPPRTRTPADEAEELLKAVTSRSSKAAQ